MRVRIPWSWASLLIGFLAVIGLAIAADIPPRCQVPTVASIKQMIQVTPSTVVFEFRGEDAKLGIRLFNALPPAGHEAGDHFYIVMRPDFPLSRLLVSKDGCVKNGALVGVQIAVAIKKAIKVAAVKLSI